MSEKQSHDGIVYYKEIKKQYGTCSENIDLPFNITIYYFDHTRKPSIAVSFYMQ